MLTENERMTRQKFMPIAILEHHQMIDPVLDAYDICDQLGPVWLQIQREAQACTFTLDADCIQSINERIARSLGMDAGIFRNKEGLGKLSRWRRKQRRWSCIQLDVLRPLLGPPY